LLRPNLRQAKRQQDSEYVFFHGEFSGESGWG
jgi:hypothetical protein